MGTWVGTLVEVPVRTLVGTLVGAWALVGTLWVGVDRLEGGVLGGGLGQDFCCRVDPGWFVVPGYGLLCFPCNHVSG